MGVLFKNGFALVFLLIGILPVVAQENDFIKEEGEVVEGEFLISKELEITLPSAQRIFQKVAPDEINAKVTEPLQYTFSAYTPQLKDIRTRLRVLKLKDEKSVPKPGSYLKLGFGNYITPYVEAGLNSGVNKMGNYGVKLYHLSSLNGPVDKENSGDSHSSINLFGKYIGGKVSIGGDLEYNRDGYHFYGYDPGIEVSKDSIDQTFNDINLGIDIKSSDADSPIQYDIYGRVYNISDKYNASELGVKIGLNSNYLINENMYAKLGLDYLFVAYKNPEQINRTLFRVTPAFVYTKNALTLDVGVRVVNTNDTLNNKNKTQIYPAFYAAYDLTDNITAYGSLDGDVEEVTLKSMVNENPYLAGNLPITHTNKNLDILLGVKGSLFQYLAFDVGIRSAVYKNMYFYVNDPLGFNKFDVVYDEGNTSLFQGIVSLSYFKNNTLGTTLTSRFNTYNTGELEKAWHRPKMELDYLFWYNFYDKVKLTANFFVLTGIEAVDLRESPATSKTLESAVDLNVKVDYILSDRYSVFVSVNNLLDNNYQLYNRYPTRGLLAMVGLSLSF